MTKTIQYPNSTVTPEYLNAIANPVFDDQDIDGHNSRLDDNSLSNAPGHLKARLAAIADELKVSPSSGLYVSVQAGKVGQGTDALMISEQLVECHDDQPNNYIVVVDGGAIEVHTAMPSAGLLLARVVTSGGEVGEIVDMRVRFALPSGAVFAPLNTLPQNGVVPVWNASTKRFETTHLNIESIGMPPAAEGNRAFFLRRKNSESPDGRNDVEWFEIDLGQIQTDINQLQSDTAANAQAIANSPDLSDAVTAPELTDALSGYATQEELAAAFAAAASGGGSGGGSTPVVPTGQSIWDGLTFTGTPSPTAESAAVNMIQALIDAGVWIKLHRFYVATSADIEDVPVDWVSGTKHSLLGTFSFTEEEGITGASTTTHTPTRGIASGLELTNERIENFSSWVFMDDLANPNTQNGMLSATKGGHSYLRLANNNVFWGTDASNNIFLQSPRPSTEPKSLGSNFGSSGSNNSGLFFDGTLTVPQSGSPNATTDSSDSAANEMVMFGGGEGGTPPLGGRFLLGAYADYLSPAESTALNNAVMNYLNTLGVWSPDLPPEEPKTFGEETADEIFAELTGSYSSADQQAMADLIDALKNSGAWDRITALFLPVLANIHDAMYDIKGKIGRSPGFTVGNYGHANKYGLYTSQNGAYVYAASVNSSYTRNSTVMNWIANFGSFGNASITQGGMQYSGNNLYAPGIVSGFGSSYVVGASHFGIPTNNFPVTQGISSFVPSSFGSVWESSGQLKYYANGTHYGTASPTSTTYSFSSQNAQLFGYGSRHKAGLVGYSMTSSQITAVNNAMNTYFSTIGVS